MYRRLLVPLDGSRMAEAVLPVVERLGVICSATVILLHVLERSAPATVHGERHLRAQDEADAYLHDVAARLRTHDLTVESHTHEVPEGDVPGSISAHVEEERADLIVLCTHGSGGIRDLLFGSIAQQVLKHGTVPVLLVRASQDAAEAFEPRCVLVPLDGTAAAEAALDHARDLARLLDTVLHLVTVVATPGTVRGEGQVVAQALPTGTRAALDLEVAEASEYLEGVAQRLRGGGVTVTTEVRRGDTASALAAGALESGAGLVVVATHGRAGVQALWTGSVTARLLARTRAPLLLLRTVE